MRKALEYEQHAAECRQMAAQMKNPQQKKQLEDMADVWDRLGRSVDRDRREQARSSVTPNGKIVFYASINYSRGTTCPWLFCYRFG